MEFWGDIPEYSGWSLVELRQQTQGKKFCKVFTKVRLIEVYEMNGIGFG